MTQNYTGFIQVVLQRKVGSNEQLKLNIHHKTSYTQHEGNISYFKMKSSHTASATTSKHEIIVN